MKKQIQAFSLVFAMIFMFLLSLLALYVLDYMIPFSKRVSGIEQATQAFYHLQSGVEYSAYRVYAGGFWYPESKTLSGESDFSFHTISTGTTIPRAGYGKSPYNADWNIISQIAPISLVVGSGILNSATVGLSVRVPGGATLVDPDDLLVWQLNSETDSLTLEDSSLIDVPYSSGNIMTQNGETLSGSTQTFSNFYTNNCGGGKDCVLKISLLRPLKTANGILPFLEYKISSPTKALRNQEVYVNISSQDQSYSRDLQIAFPDKVTSSAFIFTVLQ